MKLKQYETAGVTYGYSLQSKKWEFKIGETFTFLTTCPGGKTMGEKISRLVKAGYVRTGGNGIGGLARANIEKVLTSSVK